MSQKWNLQDIRPAGEKRPKRRITQKPRPEISHEPVQEDIDDAEVESVAINDRPKLRRTKSTSGIVIEDGTKKDRNKVILAAVFFVAVIGAAALLSSLLGKTELTIYPEFEDPSINADFTAFAASTDGSLSYEIMTLEETKESQVEASGSITVEESATGILEISKSTPGAERLITNTRFRAPDGSVYRIQEPVVVPGAINGAPGTIQAEVIANDIGEEFNQPARTTFDVPGFDEGGFTELYDAITASNPAAITGGFDGPQFQIDDGELNTARQALQIELRDSLLQKIDANKPAGMIAFPGAVAITYNQLPAIEYGDDLVTIKEQAVLQIPLFRSGEMGMFLAEQSIATYSGGPVRIEDPAKLVFNYTSATTSNSVIANATSLEFGLTGKPRLIWEYDGEKLAADLAGLPKTAINNAITAYPGIERARVQITPFWKRTFPENAEDIEVIEVIDDN